MPTILGHSDVREEGGWLHTVTFRTDGGAVVTIEDDSDLVTAFSDTKDAISLAELSELWSVWAMGCSHFPAQKMPGEEGVIEWSDERLPVELVREMDGAEFSHLA